MMKRILVLVALLASALGAQTPVEPPGGVALGPVANMPACTASNKGQIYVVTDADANDDCSTGGGADVNDCICNGSAFVDADNASGGGAPTDATYITQTANGTLSAEQVLASLSSGIMRVATTTGVITSLTTSAGIAANLSDESGTGVIAFTIDPVFTTPNLGTPSALVLTNATGLPLTTGVTGVLPVANFTTGTPDGTKFVRDDGVLAVPAGGGGSGHVIQDEGTPLTARAALNFTGAGISASDDVGNDATVVTLADDIAAVEALAGTGFVVRTGTATWTNRSIEGTANQISVSNSNGVSGTPTIFFPATVDLGALTSFEIPNGAAPTVDAFGEIAGDNDAWAASRGAPVFFDGTAAVRLIGALASDTPTNGQVPTWNTGGTITWETSSAFGETSLAGLANNQRLWDDASASRTLTAGLSGATDPVFTFANNSVSLNVPFNALGGVFGDPTVGAVISANAGTTDTIGGAFDLEEGTIDTGTPAAGFQRIYVRTADSVLVRETSAAAISAFAFLTNTLGDFAATTSAQLASVLSDEAGSGGGFVRATSPTLTTPALGTPSAAVLTNATGLPTAGLVDAAVTPAKASAALKTKSIPFWISDPATGDSDNMQWLAPTAVTITRIDCSCETGTADIEFEERVLATPNTAGTEVMGADLQCDNNNAQDATFANAAIAADALLSMKITAVATCTQLRVNVRATVD